MRIALPVYMESKGPLGNSEQKRLAGGRAETRWEGTNPSAELEGIAKVRCCRKRHTQRHHLVWSPSFPLPPPPPRPSVVPSCAKTFQTWVRDPRRGLRNPPEGCP